MTTIESKRLAGSRPATSGRAKGNKDRAVMLSPRLLVLLRAYWNKSVQRRRTCHGQHRTPAHPARCTPVSATIGPVRREPGAMGRPARTAHRSRRTPVPGVRRAARPHPPRAASCSTRSRMIDTSRRPQAEPPHRDMHRRAVLHPSLPPLRASSTPHFRGGPAGRAFIRARRRRSAHHFRNPDRGFPETGVR